MTLGAALKQWSNGVSPYWDKAERKLNQVADEEGLRGEERRELKSMVQVSSAEWSTS